MFAISGTSGSSGLASVSKEEIDRSTLEIVSAGLHWSFRMSRQIERVTEEDSECGEKHPIDWAQENGRLL